jgi:hypothetical protein
MATQPAAADAAAAEEAPPATTIAALPRALLARVLARVPVDTRLRCCEVSSGWSDFLATERSLWTALDLSKTSGVTHKVTDALLRAAAAKAGGALTTLDVSGCYGRGPSYDALLEVLTANAGHLTELHLERTFLDDDDRTCEKTTTLLRAAPRLRLLGADLDCNADDAARMLHNEVVFQPLRVHALDVDAEEADAAALHALAVALAAHAPPLSHLSLGEAQLGAADVLDALVDAALSNRVAAMEFEACALPAASAPSLVRLLGGSALTSLTISCNLAQLLDAPAAALLGSALRTNGVLRHLKLSVRLWVDLGAAMTLLSSLAAHPSLRELSLAVNKVAPEHAACAGMALFALLAANARALRTLSVSFCNLGDVGLRPLFEALPRNTHLRTLRCAGNDMSEAFARDVLLPAVRANTSLLTLWTGERHTGAMDAEALVVKRRSRRAPRRRAPRHRTQLN